MRERNVITLALTFLAAFVYCGTASPARAQGEASPYATMAPLSQYMMAEDAEIALARSGAPASISSDAEVLVLRRDGYATAAKGSNGFVCLVQRGWAAATEFTEFWNPAVRAPICYNPAAARTYMPLVVKKTKWVVAGKSKAEIAKAVAEGFATKELPSLEPGAMCYMMSRQQYLNDQGKAWHPHMMWFVPGDAAKSWGANLPDSPAMAANDPEERMTIMLVAVSHWSDGTPAPPDTH